MNDTLRGLLGLPEQASSVARDIDMLHLFVILTTLLGAACVGLVALWFAVRFRRRPGYQLTPRVQANPWWEAGLIGALTCLFVGWWVIGYRQYLHLQVPPIGAYEILVSAKQWMWSFAYPGGQRSLSMLVVPVGRPIKLVMMSRDVIHGFFVPAFRIKHDVVPGYVSVAWFQAEYAGTFQILCTQYCGTSHSTMRGEVVALAPADFALWLQGSRQPTRAAEAEEAAERQATTPGGDRLDISHLAIDGDPIDRGRRAAARHGCLSCHTEDGQRHIGPTWRGLYGSRVELADGRSLIADAEYLTRCMMDPLGNAVAGYQTVMPSYRGTLDPDDAASIVEFIKCLAMADAPAAVANPSLPTQPYRVGPP